jgi:diadenosine tetraphosphate (Ap4A) HIT family hydrolase
MPELQMKKEKGAYEVDLHNAMVLGVLGNSRTLQQYVHTYEMFQAGKCPFCNLEELKFPPLFHVGNWAVKKCDMPYTNCEHHLILVYTGGHVTDWDLLSRDDDADFMEAIRRAEKMFNIKGCAVVFRRGDPSYHAGTISHIHGHIMVVQLDEDGLPVGQLRAYFAKTRQELEYCRKMVGIFEKVRKEEVAGVTKGIIVFNNNGRYLTSGGQLVSHNKPQEAELLHVPADEIKERYDEGTQYYEAMTSEETGILLIDGPHDLK